MGRLEPGGVLEQLRRVACRGGGFLPTDAQLLDRFLSQHDECAFADLVRRHGPMVLGVCRGILLDHQDAEDAFQATFLVLARKARWISAPEQLAGWLHGVACRTARKARTLRARNRGREKPIVDRAGADSEDPVERQELCALLDQELSRLPEKYRTPLVLCELEGCSRKDAAHLLSLPEGTLSSRLARGRRLLADRLTRSGFPLLAATFGAVFVQARAEATLPDRLVGVTAQAGAALASGASPLPFVSTRVVALAEGVVWIMRTAKLTGVLAGLLVLVLLGGIGWHRSRGSDTSPGVGADRDEKQAGEKLADRKGPQRSVILLWMSGGPSQIDTFDPKPGHANGGPFKPIPTATKGIQISEHLPRLAKHSNHLALIRSLQHGEGDHLRASYLMRTGYVHQPGIEHPGLGSVLARELGGARPRVPGYVRIGGFWPVEFSQGFLGPGFLGPRYAPLIVKPRPEGELIPALDDFKAIYGDQAETVRKVMAEAMKLDDEKAALRREYGDNSFGRGCLLARRLVERGVPVVEVVLGGWDTHADNFTLVEKLSGTLDAGWATLMKDLEEKKLLDRTLVVWAGEFGRTPRINAGKGRDHWMRGFSVVLAGGGIRGGQVIGRTSADGMTIAERPVSVGSFLATIYQAVHIDPNKTNTAAGREFPLVPGKPEPIREILDKGGRLGTATSEFESRFPLARRLATLPGLLVEKKVSDEELVDALFLATLARLPAGTERKVVQDHLGKQKDRLEAARDLLWSVVNSQEFLRLHRLSDDRESAKEFQETLSRAWEKAEPPRK
jgi:RNA polymerase sigma factor (sigma-70 family)